MKSGCVANKRVLLIDNRDAFTHNLAEALGRLGLEVSVHRNSVSVEQAHKLAQGRLVVLSPGPGRPASAGCLVPLVRRLRGLAPVLGICLGHQAVLEEAGAELVRAAQVVHGKATRLVHDGQGPFSGLPCPLRVARYHSLCVNEVPARFRVHARHEGMAMAISDLASRQIGFQFHPESILTPEGDSLLRNVVRLLMEDTAHA
ncbi:MAG: gamma-glutamyl-gamma-aminobutyrate hydrolase family protein [Proteobacteria bacterium]|nr:gamma-glutamyl-gamma-aminobutyrate hydrolase family protein [Pseudomonadota bacterium]